MAVQQNYCRQGPHTQKGHVMKLFLILFGTLCLGSNYLIAENLIGGKLTDHFPELIAIRSGQGFCSSTLIGPNTILTAAHCIDKKTKK